MSCTKHGWDTDACPYCEIDQLETRVAGGGGHAVGCLQEEHEKERLAIRNETLKECIELAEDLKPDRFGKLERFQVADAIRELLNKENT